MLKKVLWLPSVGRTHAGKRAVSQVPFRYATPLDEPVDYTGQSGYLFAGNAILSFLGLSQSFLNISGGVLLFIISLRMIFPKSSSGEEVEGEDDPFLVPLAIPLIAGPSTIAILLLLNSSEPARLLEWTVALFMAWLGTTVLLVASPFLLRILGRRGSRALERLMGMILVMLATQMLLNGVRDFAQSM